MSARKANTAKAGDPAHQFAQALRRNRRPLPLRPFEILSDESRDDPVVLREAAAAQHREGWRRGPHCANPWAADFDWEHAPSRDFGWRLHAWEPLELLLLAAAAGDDGAFADALAAARAWIAQYGGADASDADGFAWYDMSFAYRAHRLAFLLDLACRRDDVADEDLALLAGALEKHFETILRDDLFHGHNNHGLYQALTALAAGRRWQEMRAAAQVCRISQARLEALFSALIDQDGILREHSPGYQLLVLRLLERAAGANLLSPEQIERQAAMGRSLAWFVMPDGMLAPFGDTDPDLFRAAPDARELRFHRNAYRRAEGARERPFAQAGFWIGREGQSALAVHAGFHSMVHKHADHGTFLWYENGRPLLIEAGFFPYEGRTADRSQARREGFYYSDPRRIHVEATRAHNCVEIGGESYPRRGVGFFGSAIRHARFDEDGAVVAMGFVHPSDIRHERLLAWVPGRFLLVIDQLSAPKALPDLRQWFHLAPDIAVESFGNGWRGEALTIASLAAGTVADSACRGVERPHLQGWHGIAHGVLAPHTAIALKAGGAPHAMFATLLTPNGDIVNANTQSLFLQDSRDGTLAWRDRRGDVAVAIVSGAQGLDARIGASR